LGAAQRIRMMVGLVGLQHARDIGSGCAPKLHPLAASRRPLKTEPGLETHMVALMSAVGQGAFASLV
jgi:hypothetical protein